MCNNNIQPRVFGIERLLQPSIDINAFRFASGINIDLSPQQTFNTSKPGLNLILILIHNSKTLASFCSWVEPGRTPLKQACLTVSLVMRKPVNAICEQQRRRSACASAHSDKRLCCSLSGWYNTSTCYSRNFKTLASLISWADRFESYLVAATPLKQGFLESGFMGLCDFRGSDNVPASCCNAATWETMSDYVGSADCTASNPPKNYHKKVLESFTSENIHFDRWKSTKVHVSFLEPLHQTLASYSKVG